MAETPREGQPGSGPDGGVLLLDRKFDRGTLATMRGELSRCGSASGVAELALANFVLAVNEIMTNAVRYAGGRGSPTPPGRASPPGRRAARATS